MIAASSLFRSLIIYAVCVPLAVILGYLMATGTSGVAWPLFDDTTSTVLGLLLFLLVFPLLLRWYHFWLAAFWNAAFVLPFLPGRPPAFQVLAWVGLGIAVGQYILNRRLKFIAVPSISRPLFFMLLVVLVTAKCTGGMGMKIFGSESFGGHKYFDLLTAIVGYFALTSQQIPRDKAALYVSLFLLSAVTNSVGELADLAPGPIWYPIFMFFPVSSTGVQAITQGAESVSWGFARLAGLSAASSAIVYWMLARHGVREMLTMRRLGRALFFIALVFIGMLGGFRSAFIFMVLILAVVSYLEGMWRSPVLPTLGLVGLLALTVMSPFLDRLPFSVQRSLSFLPINVSPVVRESAAGSSAWRLQMWKEVLPDVPSHLLLGKGYAFASADLQAAGSTPGSDYGTAGAELVGDYHNGPLSVILPFGIWGVIAMAWLLVGGVKVLYQNYLYGDPAYQRVNALILAYFIAKTVVFTVVVGGLTSDIMAFTGLLALSISLNGGVAAPVAVPRPRIVFNRFKLHPSARPIQ